MTIYFILYASTYKDWKYIIIKLNKLLDWVSPFSKIFIGEMCVTWDVGNKFGYQFLDSSRIYSDMFFFLPVINI